MPMVEEMMWPAFQFIVLAFSACFNLLLHENSKGLLWKVEVMQYVTNNAGCRFVYAKQGVRMVSDKIVNEGLG